MHADEGAEHVVISTPCSACLFLLALIGITFAILERCDTMDESYDRHFRAAVAMEIFDLHTSQWPPAFVKRRGPVQKIKAYKAGHRI